MWVFLRESWGMEPLRIPHPNPEMAPKATQGLIDEISVAFQSFPDERKPGNNRKYSLSDAACSAFSVFFTQSPSFLSFQRTLERNTGRSNVHPFRIRPLQAGRDVPMEGERGFVFARSPESDLGLKNKKTVIGQKIQISLTLCAINRVSFEKGSIKIFSCGGRGLPGRG